MSITEGDLIRDKSTSFYLIVERIEPGRYTAYDSCIDKDVAELINSDMFKKGQTVMVRSPHNKSGNVKLYNGSFPDSVSLFQTGFIATIKYLNKCTASISWGSCSAEVSLACLTPAPKKSWIDKTESVEEEERRILICT